MAGDTTITVIGNLTDDPELKFTSSGVAVAKFRLASTPRFMDKASGEWKDGDPLFLACTIWRQAAENVAESLQRGARVVVVGRLRQRSYETQQGEKRTVVELEVDEVGPSLRYATAKVQKMQRSGGNGGFGGEGGGGGYSGGGGGGGGGGYRGAGASGGASASGGGGGGNQGGGSYAEDPWANAAPAGRSGGGGGSGSSFDDEPPF
jgi:single-strand DNA-binding protein